MPGTQYTLKLLNTAEYKYSALLKQNAYGTIGFHEVVVTASANWKS